VARSFPKTSMDRAIIPTFPKILGFAAVALKALATLISIALVIPVRLAVAGKIPLQAVTLNPRHFRRLPKLGVNDLCPKMISM